MWPASGIGSLALNAAAIVAIRGDAAA